MSSEKVRKEFERRLTELIGQFTDQLSPETVGKLLHRFGRELGAEAPDGSAVSEQADAEPPDPDAVEDDAEPASSAPDPRGIYHPSESRLVISVPSAEWLDEKSDGIGSDRGLVIKVEGDPRVLDPVEVTFEVGDTATEPETFNGRIVQKSPDGCALQLQADPDTIADRLDALAERARRAATTASADTSTSATIPATPSAIPSEEQAEHSSEPEADADERSPHNHGSFGSARPSSAANDTASFQRVSSSTYERPDIQNQESTRELDALGAPEKTWDLAEQPLAEVLAEAAAREGAGLCRLKSGRRRWDVVLKDGQLFEIIEDPPQENKSLGALLVRSGHLDEDQLESARQRANRLGITLPEALRDLQTLAYQKLILAMKSQVVILLRDLLEADVDQADWTELARLPRNYFHPPLILLTRLYDSVVDHVSRGNKEQLKRYRDHYRGQRLQRAPQDAFRWGALQFEGREARLVESVLDEPRRMDDILRASPLNDAKTIGVIAALDQLGALTRHTFDRARQTRERKLEHVDLLHKQTANDNLFERLGLHWTTYGEEVRETQQQIHDQLASLEDIDEMDDERRRKVDQIRSRVDEACQQLGNKRQRRAYRKKNYDDFEYRAAVKTFEDQLEMLTMQRKPTEVMDRSRRILELRPNHEQARQLLNRAKSLESKKSKKSNSG